MKRMLPLLAFLAVAGCQTIPPEQIAAQRAAAAAARAAADDAECQSYGAIPGSDAYVSCRLALKDMAQREQFERRRRSAAAMAEMQRDMRASRPVDCISRRRYGTIRTTCF